MAGLFSVALVVAKGLSTAPRPAVSGLAALWCSDFPLLARIHRSKCDSAATARPVLMQGLCNYNKALFNRYSTGKVMFVTVTG